jgi:hypothetical protein
MREIKNEKKMLVRNLKAIYHKKYLVRLPENIKLDIYMFLTVHFHILVK